MVQGRRAADLAKSHFLQRVEALRTILAGRAMALQCKNSAVDAADPPPGICISIAALYEER